MRQALALLLLVLASACGAPAPDEAPDAGNRSGPAPVALPKAGSASAGIPPRFHGSYDRSQAECGAPSVYRLVIDARSLRFHESLAQVRSVDIDGPNAIIVAADYQGEGESWSARQSLGLSQNGERLTIIGNGTETVRVRCGNAGTAPPRWEGAASGEGDGLWLTGPDARRINFFCPAGEKELVVNVLLFRAIGSEERMSFGSGGTVVALVADSRGDSDRGGVTARGPVPTELETILSSPGGVSISYGAQTEGPHATPPADLAAAFVAGCRD